jgi:aspartate racemase
VLVVLFSAQRFGTGAVGRPFGPVMLVWFAVLARAGSRRSSVVPGGRRPPRASVDARPMRDPPGMRRIGLLGGMSWESSAEYYRLVNEATRQRLGGLHSADCLLRSVDFAEVEALQRAGDWERAGALLAAEAVALVGAGAELLVLCTNTMHKVADAIEAATSVPLLHLGDATALAVRRAGVDTVGLLGTAFTMEQDFYRSRLESHGLTVLVPEPQDRALVHRVIYDELCVGVVRSESRDAYVGVVTRLAERGAQGVVLGCTEIELLLHPEDTDLPLFATTRLHVEAALQRAPAPLPTGP